MADGHMICHHESEGIMSWWERRWSRSNKIRVRQNLGVSYTGNRLRNAFPEKSRKNAMVLKGTSVMNLNAVVGVGLPSDTLFVSWRRGG